MSHCANFTINLNECHDLQATVEMAAVNATPNRKTYPCRFCDRVFGYRSTRSRHASKQHGGLYPIIGDRSLFAQRTVEEGSIAKFRVIHPSIDDDDVSSVDCLREPERFSKDVRQFLEDYVREKASLHWLPLCAKAHRRWPNLSPEVIDCVLWVGLECARMGVTVSPPIWQDNSNKAGQSDWNLFVQIVKGITPSYVGVRRGEVHNVTSDQGESQKTKSKTTKKYLDKVDIEDLRLHVRKHNSSAEDLNNAPGSPQCTNAGSSVIMPYFDDISDVADNHLKPAAKIPECCYSPNFQVTPSGSLIVNVELPFSTDVEMAECGHELTEAAPSNPESFLSTSCEDLQTVINSDIMTDVLQHTELSCSKLPLLDESAELVGEIEVITTSVGSDHEIIRDPAGLNEESSVTDNPSSELSQAYQEIEKLKQEITELRRQLAGGKSQCGADASRNAEVVERGSASPWKKLYPPHLVRTKPELKLNKIRIPQI